MKESRYSNQLTKEEVKILVQMNTIEDCKKCMRVMLDFYLDVIMSL